MEIRSLTHSAGTLVEWGNQIINQPNQPAGIYWAHVKHALDIQRCEFNRLLRL